MFWRWRNKLFAPSPLLCVSSWLHPFKGHCEQKAMRDEVVMYVAGHPILNRRCTILPVCFHFPKRKLNYKLYSLIVLKVPLNSDQSIFCRNISPGNHPEFDMVPFYQTQSNLILPLMDQMKSGCSHQVQSIKYPVLNQTRKLCVTNYCDTVF